MDAFSAFPRISTNFVSGKCLDVLTILAAQHANLGRCVTQSCAVRNLSANLNAHQVRRDAIKVPFNAARRTCAAVRFGQDVPPVTFRKRVKMVSV